MTPALDQCGGETEPVGHHRHDGTAKAGTDDDDLERFFDHDSAQTGHSMAGKISCPRFMACKRCRRCSRQVGHEENCSRFQVSAKTLPARKFKASSCAFS